MRVIACGPSAPRGLALLRALRRRGIAGAIDVDQSWLTARRVAIRAWQFPLVMIGDQPPGIQADTVMIDEAFVARCVLDHFRELGHRRCGYLITLDVPHARKRFAKFAEQARECGMWDESLVLDLRPFTADEPSSSPELGRFKQLDRFFARQPKPLAMFSHNDFVSASLIEWLLERGYRVPHDVAIAGLDNHPLYALANVPLTTVDPNWGELGRQSVRLLLERLQATRSLPCRHLLLPPHLEVRESTVGEPAGQEWLVVVMRAMREHLAEPGVVQKVLVELKWRQDVLAQRFRRAMGCTLLDYRDRLRLDRAAELLLDAEAPKVSAVAREVGFSSAGRFAAAFRRRFGMNPLEFQARHRPRGAR